MEGKTILAEIIPFVKLEHIVLPERLSKKAEEARQKAELEEKDEEEQKLQDIKKNFELGERLARKKVKDITKKNA